ncbi:DNA glycosylase [Pterulicium gracile]|uniref:DNA glycosylase n=1 Tax=Pterulicium gracile TaxID=1884261 RepID=A0A5C3R1X2_9AGAR|nr:DNA glycosylase [Pterula gracilis]
MTAILLELLQRRAAYTFVRTLDRMPTTRSASRVTSTPTTSKPVSTAGSKRKSPASTSASVKPASTKRQRVAKPVDGSLAAPETALPVEAAETSATASNADAVPSEPEEPMMPAVLSFSLEDAKAHLIDVDSRFEDIFEKLQCKPYEKLERVHPFRALVESILGQQISWLAARSIKHKFIRLFDPSLPEKATDYVERKSAAGSFPTAQQVAKLDLVTLKSAGLSTRKAEYIQDLALRFSDGRLSTEKIMESTDEELAEMLIAVRGIGVWTVHMFAMFSLRRPDILPAGDLGVQRGMLRWFLSLHSEAHPFTLSPEKVNTTGRKAEDSAKDILPELPSSTAAAKGVADALEVNSVQIAAIPPPFTPSIKKTLGSEVAKKSRAPLPAGITVELLKSRLQGKKVKGAFLTPQEMEDLTEPWKPYRSIGVYYMWSLADANGK